MGFWIWKKGLWTPGLIWQYKLWIIVFVVSFFVGNAVCNVVFVNPVDYLAILRGIYNVYAQHHILAESRKITCQQRSWEVYNIAAAFSDVENLSAVDVH